MTDLILKITIATLIYGGLCFAFGLALGKALKSVADDDEWFI